MMRVCLTVWCGMCVWFYNQCNAIIACSYISQSIRTRSSGIASVRVPKILWIFSYRQMKKLTPIITSEIFNFLFQFKVQVTCFQSVNDGSSQSRREIEMEIINNNDSLVSNNFEVSGKLCCRPVASIICGHNSCCFALVDV